MRKEAKTCQFEGCGRIVYARGYCRHHYSQLWRQGQVQRARSLSEQKKAMPFRNLEILRSLNQEIKGANAVYQPGSDLDGRAKWSSELQNIKQEIMDI